MRAYYVRLASLLLSDVRTGAPAYCVENAVRQGCHGAYDGGPERDSAVQANNSPTASTASRASAPVAKQNAPLAGLQRNIRHSLRLGGLWGRCRGLATGREVEDASDQLGPFGGAVGLEEALDRALVETYRLLQEGKVEQAEVLLLEGLKSAETVLSEGDPLLAQLCDQVALLQYFQGRFKHAEQHAVRSLAAMRGLPESDGRAAAVALCTLRLGAIHLGLEHRTEAAGLLRDAHAALLSLFGPDYGPVNEAGFHLILATLPERFSEHELVGREARMAEALKVVSSTPGVGAHLLRAALREHRALMDRAVAVQDWQLAEAILQQAVRIQEQLCPGSEEMALTTYQYGTLQYVRGLHARAEELCSSSLALSRRLYLKDSSSQVALRLHRLGTLHLARGDGQKAVQALEQSCKNLIRNVGEDNPLTGESRAALALAKLGLLDASHARADPYTRILNPARRAALLAEAQAGLRFMRRGFGGDHMLVRKMLEIHAEVLRAAAGHGVEA